MPTIFGILTFISMINTTSERLKARNFFICGYFSFYEQLNFVRSEVEHEKSFITSGPGVNKTHVQCCGKIFPSYVIAVQPHEITKYETCAFLHRFHILYISCDRSTSQHII